MSGLKHRKPILVQEAPIDARYDMYLMFTSIDINAFRTGEYDGVLPIETCF